MVVSGLASSRRSEISDRGLQSAVPIGRRRWSSTETAPGGASGGSITSLRKIHGCPSSQRWAPLAETIVESTVKNLGGTDRVDASRWCALRRRGVWPRVRRVIVFGERLDRLHPCDVAVTIRSFFATILVATRCLKSEG